MAAEDRQAAEKEIVEREPQDVAPAAPSERPAPNTTASGPAIAKKSIVATNS